MKKVSEILAAVTLLLACGNTAAQQVPAAGIYDAVDGWGYMKIERVNNDGLHKVQLEVGGGSCGGEVMLNGRTTTLFSDELTFYRVEGTRSCRTTISFTPNGAAVSDTCNSPESEANTTCALMGEYEKRQN